jgi:hypothetical protein
MELNKTAVETFNLLREAYGENAVSIARVFERCKRFSEKREDVVDDERPDHPITTKTDESVEDVKLLVRIDVRIGIRMTVEEFNMDTETVKPNFNMKKCVSKWPQRILQFLPMKQNTNAGTRSIITGPCTV